VGEICANIFAADFFWSFLPHNQNLVHRPKPLLLHSLIHSPPTHSLSPPSFPLLPPPLLSSLFPPSCPLPTTRTPTRTAPRLSMQSSAKPLVTGTSGTLASFTRKEERTSSAGTSAAIHPSPWPLTMVTLTYGSVPHRGDWRERRQREQCWMDSHPRSGVRRSSGGRSCSRGGERRGREQGEQQWLDSSPYLSRHPQARVRQVARHEERHGRAPVGQR